MTLRESSINYSQEKSKILNIADSHGGGIFFHFLESFYVVFMHSVLSAGEQQGGLVCILSAGG